VEDVFDPDIEATLAGENSDDQAGQIVGRLFGDAAAAATAADEQGAESAQAAAGAQSAAAPAESATTPAETASAQSAPDEKGGRVTALPPPVADPTRAPAADSPAPAPVSERETERPLQFMDVVKHKHVDFGLDRN